MAKVNVQVPGGAIKQVEAGTIEDLKAAMNAPNHVATVNGDTQENSYELSDYEFVALTVATKGA